MLAEQSTLSRFFVEGIPIQQGSKAPWGAEVNAKTLRPWQREVKRVATEQQLDVLDCPVFVSLEFFFPRPKSHFTKKGLRPNASQYVTRTPDLDKLARAVLDALGEVAYVDDRKVSVLVCSKRYAHGKPGVEVCIGAMT